MVGFNKLVATDFLTNNDVVDIVAPSSSCPKEHLILAVDWLKKQNLIPRYHPDILKPEFYLAQSDSYRLQQLYLALTNSESKAVWCLRGGYGSIRLIPEMIKWTQPSKYKLFIGLSDITSLHQFLNQNWNWPTLHASLLDRLGQKLLPTDNEQELVETLFGQKKSWQHNNLKWLNEEKFQSQLFLSGVLVGGNLTTFVSSIGTPLELLSFNQSSLQNKNIILFFEDIAERGYKVDRMLQQIKMSRFYEQISAVVFGDFTQCEEKNGENLVPIAISDFAKKVDFPVLSGVRSGHGQWQAPLFFNTYAELTCELNSKMVIFSGHETK